MSWSSYRGIAGIENHIQQATIDWILKQFDKHREKARKSYKEFVMSGIRGESIWEGVKGQSLLGREDFVKKLIKYIKGARRDEKFQDIRDSLEDLV